MPSGDGWSCEQIDLGAQAAIKRREQIDELQETNKAVETQDAAGNKRRT